MSALKQNAMAIAMAQRVSGIVEKFATYLREALGPAGAGVMQSPALKGQVDHYVQATLALATAIAGLNGAPDRTLLVALACEAQVRAHSALLDAVVAELGRQVSDAASGASGPH